MATVNEFPIVNLHMLGISNIRIAELMVPPTENHLQSVEMVKIVDIIFKIGVILATTTIISHINQQTNEIHKFFPTTTINNNLDTSTMVWGIYTTIILINNLD